jgi:hypothetical protein
VNRLVICHTLPALSTALLLSSSRGPSFSSATFPVSENGAREVKPPRLKKGTRLAMPTKMCFASSIVAIGLFALVFGML